MHMDRILDGDMVSSYKDAIGLPGASCQCALDRILSSANAPTTRGRQSDLYLLGNNWKSFRIVDIPIPMEAAESRSIP